MKKLFILSVYLFIVNVCYAQQHFFTSFFTGLASYRGDLGSSNFYLDNAKPAVGVGAVFELNDRMLIRSEFNYGTVSGDDKYNIKTRNRNLSFTSKVTEFALLFEYTLFNLYDYKVSPYFFAGVGTFKFSPYTTDQNGKQVYLAEQNTEGQGFYKDRKDYGLNKMAIPFGGGVQWSLAPNKRLALEFGLRKTNTDYLDDVSTTYVDKSLLEQKRGYTAVKLAYRAMELPNSRPYPVEGAKRGNPDNQDWYIFTGVSFRISVQPTPWYKKRKNRHKYKPAKTSCPTIF